MTAQVRIGDPLSAEGRALLSASQAFMASIYAADENFALTTEALAAPGVLFLIAETDDGPTGCAALVSKDGYGEIKSMFVDPAARGTGTGSQLMDALEVHARELGLPLLRLETGPELAAAVRLYERHGYALRGPFGDYPDTPASLFMEKRL